MDLTHLRKTIRPTIAVSLAVVAIFAGLVSWALYSLNSSLQAVDRADQAIVHAQRLNRLQAELERELRGFLVSGNEAVLQPYDEASKALDSEYRLIERLVADDPPQQMRLAAWRESLQNWQSYAGRTIALRRNRGTDSSPDESAQGARAMGDIRDQATEFQQVEEQRYDSASQAAFFRWHLVAGGCIFLGLGISLVLAIYFRHRMTAMSAEYRQSLQTLEASEQRWSAMLASIGDAVIVTDAHGRVTFFNPAVMAMTGWQAADALGQPIESIFKVFDEGSDVQVEDLLGAVLKEGLRIGPIGNRSLIDGEGRLLPVEGRAAPIRDGEGKIAGAAVVLRDVADRRRVQQAAQRSAALLECIGDTTPDSIYVKDRAGRMLYANAGTLRVLGKTREQILGRTDREWHPSFEEATALMANDNRVMESGETLVAEEVFTDSQGARLFLSTKSPLRDATGRVIGLVGVSRDITARKNADLALQASETRYRALFANMTEGFVLCEVEFDDRGEPCDYRYLEVNEAYEKATGRRREEILGKSGLKIFTHLRKAPLEVLGRTATTGESIEFEQFDLDSGRQYEAFTYRLAQGQVAVLFRDVSERKQIEVRNKQLTEAVQKERDLLSALIDNIGDEIWFTDAEKKFTLANPAARRRFGDDAVAVVDIAKLTESLEVLRPDGSPRPICEAPPIRALAGEIVRDQEEIVRTRSTGVLQHCQTSAVPVRDAAGKIVGAVSVVRDITERKRAEQALSANQTLLRLFVEHAPAALAMFDLDMRYLHASRRWMTDYGLEDRDLRGISHYDVFPEISQQWKDAHRLGLAGEVLRKDADRFVRADGSVQWIRWELRPWHDGAGKVGGILILSEEITQRRQAEEALRESEERFRLAAAATHAMVYDLDLRTKRVISLNGLYELLGYGADETDHSFGWWDRQIHPDDVAKCKAAYEWMLHGSEVFSLQYRVIHKDGRTLNVEDNAAAVRDADGTLVRVVGTVVDITRRKQIESQLRALSARVHTTAERERLRIARELHDQLGSVLTGMKMDFDWIVRKQGKGESGNISLVQDAIKTIDSTIGLVRRIATDLRPEMLDSIGLSAAIEWHATQFQRRTGIPCAVQVTEGLFGLSSDQKIAVFRIFQEALTNIARHSQAKNAVIVLARGEDSAILSIGDDGIGFNPEMRASAQNLGVAGMRERALLLGADLKIASSPGSGTTVTLRMPLEETPNSEAEES